MTLVQVAPLVGAWVEIAVTEVVDFYNRVAPLVGAWVEILQWVTKIANL